MQSTFVVVFAFIAVSGSLEMPKECENSPQIDPMSCCPSAPSLLTSDIIEKCDIYNDNKTFCEMSDCGAKVGKYLTSDGKVNTTTFKNMAAMIEYPEWGRVFDTFLKNCSAKMERPNVACKSGELFQCLTEFEMTNCPSNLWNNTAECEAFKTFMVKCEAFLHQDYVGET